MTDEKTCASCRYVGTHKRPKIMEETGFDDQLMFDDVDETVFTCRAFVNSVSLCEHSGKEIGLVPITCSAWTAPTRSKYLEEIDKKIAAREARWAQQDKEGER